MATSRLFFVFFLFKDSSTTIISEYGGFLLNIHILVFSEEDNGDIIHPIRISLILHFCLAFCQLVQRFPRRLSISTQTISNPNSLSIDENFQFSRRNINFTHSGFDEMSKFKRFQKNSMFCVHIVFFRNKPVTWDPFQALAKNKEFFLKICSLLSLLFCRTKNLFLKICSCQASTFDWWLKCVKVNGDGRNKEAKEHNAAINHFLYKRVTKPSFHFIICNM